MEGVLTGTADSRLDVFVHRPTENLSPRMLTTSLTQSASRCSAEAFTGSGRLSVVWVDGSPQRGAETRSAEAGTCRGKLL